MRVIRKAVGGTIGVLANVYALVFIVVSAYQIGEVGGVALALLFLPIAYVVLPIIALPISAFPAIVMFGGSAIGALIALDWGEKKQAATSMGGSDA